MSETNNPNAAPSAAQSPRLGQPAVSFRVRTTLGERTLEDYRGRWLLLFSHSADFTPACTSEFIALVKAHEQFKALDCELLGLSVDTPLANLAWLSSIRTDFGVEIPFPIAEDVSIAVASAYGMIHPAETNAAAVRASFLIDPAGILRLLICYPSAVGRNVDELLLTLAALRAADASGPSMPDDWLPDDDGPLPPSVTLLEAQDRMKTGVPAWDFRQQPPRKGGAR